MTTSVQQLTRIAAASALCVAGRMILIPGPNGALIHLGSAALYLAATVYGRHVGAWAGALGSLIFDILVGLSAYSLWSFVIKGGAGWIVGYFAARPDRPPTRGAVLGATLIASLWTLLGYIGAWRFVIGSWTAAVANIPFSLMTSFMGILLAVILTPGCTASCIATDRGGLAHRRFDSVQTKSRKQQ